MASAEGAAPVCGAASSFRKGTVGGAKREARRTADGPARRGRSGASASAAHVHARVPLELTRCNGARTAMLLPVICVETGPRARLAAEADDCLRD